MRARLSKRRTLAAIAAAAIVLVAAALLALPLLGPGVSARTYRVRDENQRSGTVGWKSPELVEYARSQAQRRSAPRREGVGGDEGSGLPSPAAAPGEAGPIAGYPGEPSVDRGQSITLHVSTTAPTYSIELFRMGWYGGMGGRLVTRVADLRGQSYPVPLPEKASGLIDAAWPVGYRLQTGADWASGVYVARLTASTGQSSYLMFVVRDDADPADVVFEVPIATYQAYNNWGGKSVYDYNSGGERAYKVGLDRPYASWVGAGSFFDGDYSMVRWLESRGYSVKYATSLDLHTNPRLLERSKMLLSNWHDEYWSKEMRDNLTAARDAGKSLAFFDANNVYRQVRFEPSPAGKPNHVIVCYKDRGLDPQAASLPGLATIEWRAPTVSQPENALMGVMFDGQFDWGASFPWVVAGSDHWVYEGTGLRDGDQIPGLVGYEYDKVFDNGRTPGNLAVLAESPVVTSQGRASTQNGALYTAPSGAVVFSAGTMYWPWKIDDSDMAGTGVDPRVQRMTANVLDRMTGGAPTLLPTIAPSYRQVVAADHPLAYWRLGDTGSQAADAVGSHTARYLGGATAGQPGALVGSRDLAAGVDGRSGYLEVPWSSDLNPSTFSIELWAYPAGGAGSYRGVAASRAHPTGWVLYAGANDRWELWLNDGRDGMLTVRGDAVAVERWTHLVATYDGQSARLYVNGRLSASVGLAHYQPNNSQPLTIGQGQPGAGNWFDGRLDEVALFGTALTDTQVEAHYRAGIGGGAEG